MDPFAWFEEFAVTNTAIGAWKRRDDVTEECQRIAWRACKKVLLQFQPEDWDALLLSQQTREVPILTVLDCYDMAGWLKGWLKHFAENRQKETRRNEIRQLCVREDPADDGLVEWHGKRLTLAAAFSAALED